MTIQLEERKTGNILEVEASGKLTKADYARLEPEFDRLVREHGKVRILFKMIDFHGWKASAVWEDIKFDFKHFTAIERIAMVGDKTWEKGMSLFCRPFTTAKIRYFNPAQIKEALEWLEGE